jgi:hypothetical protein
MAAPMTPFAGEDLSDEIRLTVDRESGDVVRCTRVHDAYYRCNWWRSQFVESYDNPGMKGSQLGTTYRVSKSAYLKVTRGEPSGLKIVEIKRPRIV